MTYFLLGSAFSFSLKKLRPGKKPTSVSCYTSVLTSPVLAALFPSGFLLLTPVTSLAQVPDPGPRKR